MLSDGAFKLFVYISLKADRNSGRLQIGQSQLASALSKSRRSIISYIDELSRKGMCKARMASNQHQIGELEIADAYWPYIKMAQQEQSDEQANYIRQIKNWFFAYPLVRSEFGSTDNQLAIELYNSGVSLTLIERAMLLGFARKHSSNLNSKTDGKITSLRYFLPLLDEVKQTKVSDDYWRYLRHRLDQSFSSQPKSTTEQSDHLKTVGPAKEHQTKSSSDPG